MGSFRQAGQVRNSPWRTYYFPGFATTTFGLGVITTDHLKNTIISATKATTTTAIHFLLCAWIRSLVVFSITMAAPTKIAVHSLAGAPTPHYSPPIHRLLTFTQTSKIPPTITSHSISTTSNSAKSTAPPTSDSPSATAPSSSPGLSSTSTGNSGGTQPKLTPHLR